MKNVLANRLVIAIPAVIATMSNRLIATAVARPTGSPRLSLMCNRAFRTIAVIPIRSTYSRVRSQVALQWLIVIQPPSRNHRTSTTTSWICRKSSKSAYEGAGVVSLITIPQNLNQLLRILPDRPNNISRIGQNASHFEWIRRGDSSYPS